MTAPASESTPNEPEQTLDRRDFLKAAGTACTAGAFGLAPAMHLVPPLWRPTATTRLAVIGCGPWGRTIATELATLDGAELVAVADPVDSRRASAMRKAPGTQGYANLTETLAAHPDLDAVIVATPSHLHTGATLEALAGGLHVYCEAPLATTATDLETILRAEGSAATNVTCGLLARTNPLYAHARDFVRSGAIRDLVGFRAQHHKKQSWISPARDPKDEAALNWRLDPKLSLGLAGELGIHQFDVFHWFLDEYPSAVSGSGSLQLHKDGRKVYDTINLDFEFARGRRLTYDATIANSFEKSYELFLGSAGAIKLAQDSGWLFKESDAPTLGFEVYAGRESFHDEQGITLVVDATKLAAQERLKQGVGLQEPPLRFALEAFLASIQDDSPVACPATEGARAARVAIAACKAIRTGKRIEITLPD